MQTVASIVQSLEQLAPLSLASDWDNVGLLLGDHQSSVNRIMTCLTLTPQTAAEAIERKADLVITHHPILFKATRRLTDNTSEGAMILRLARANVAVYSAHTAFDNAAGGINDELASRLQLKDVRPLKPIQGQRLLKMVVFVPQNDLKKVSDAVFAAGAGQIGQYSQCSFRSEGTGTFFGSETTNPTVGQKGRREEVPEYRLEVVCPESRLREVIQAMRTAHSYEEPAFDIYPLIHPPTTIGEGRIGVLLQPVLLEELASFLRKQLACGPVQVVGDLSRSVQRVAIACGAAAGFLPEAVQQNADVFITGEMRYHDYLSAIASNVCLVLPGHHASERCGVETLATHLANQWPQIEVWASTKECDPVQWR